MSDEIRKTIEPFAQTVVDNSPNKTLDRYAWVKYKRAIYMILAGGVAFGGSLLADASPTYAAPAETKSNQVTSGADILDANNKLMEGIIPQGGGPIVPNVEDQTSLRTSEGSANAQENETPPELMIEALTSVQLTNAEREALALITPEDYKYTPDFALSMPFPVDGRTALVPEEGSPLQTLMDQLEFQGSILAPGNPEFVIFFHRRLGGIDATVTIKLNETTSPNPNLTLEQGTLLGWAGDTIRYIEPTHRYIIPPNEGAPENVDARPEDQRQPVTTDFVGAVPVTPEIRSRLNELGMVLPENTTFVLAEVSADGNLLSVLTEASATVLYNPETGAPYNFATQQEMQPIETPVLTPVPVAVPEAPTPGVETNNPVVTESNESSEEGISSNANETQAPIVDYEPITLSDGRVVDLLNENGSVALQINEHVYPTTNLRLLDLDRGSVQPVEPGIELSHFKDAVNITGYVVSVNTPVIDFNYGNFGNRQFMVYELTLVVPEEGRLKEVRGITTLDTGVISFTTDNVTLTSTPTPDAVANVRTGNLVQISALAIDPETYATQYNSQNNGPQYFYPNGALMQQLIIDHQSAAPEALLTRLESSDEAQTIVFNAIAQSQ